MTPFGTKNGTSTYYRVVTKTFKEYLDSFLKIFLNDMKIFLNPNKCAFMIFLGMILGFIVSKERKLPNSKKIQAIIKMPPPKNPQQWDGTILQMFYKKKLLLLWHLSLNN